MASRLQNLHTKQRICQEIEGHLQRFSVDVRAPEGAVHGRDGRGSEQACVGKVGPMAEIHHGAAAVQGNGCILWQAADDLLLKGVL